MMDRQRIVLLWVAVFFMAIPLWAADLELSGYYEHTLQVDVSDVSDEQIIDASKLRVDFFSGGGKSELEFRANVNFIVYHSDILYDVSPYLPENIVQQLTDWDRTDVLQAEFPRERIYLDNAFLTWRKDFGKGHRQKTLRLRAGRQQLSWGKGYSYNPTDLFHVKNPIDPTYEKEGVTALRLDLRWGVGGEFSLVTAPDDKFKDAGYAARFGTHITQIGYDVYLTAHQIIDSTSFSVTPPTDSVDAEIVTRYQRRRAIGGEFSGGLLGLGVWFEGNYNEMAAADDFYRAIGGLDYTFRSGLYWMIEGFYNTRGTNTSPYDIADWLAGFKGEPIGKGWLMLGLRKELTGLLAGNLYVFGGSDKGFMLNPRLEYSLAQNADLTIFGAFLVGEKDSAFPSGLYSGFARATVYF